MKTLHLLIIIGAGVTSLIALGVIIISNPFNNMYSNGNYKENSAQQNDLEYKDINVNLARLVKPENICFNADD